MLSVLYSGVRNKAKVSGLSWPGATFFAKELMKNRLDVNRDSSLDEYCQLMCQFWSSALPPLTLVMVIVFVTM